jgi:hypothetical protein
MADADQGWVEGTEGWMRAEAAVAQAIAELTRPPPLDLRRGGFVPGTALVRGDHPSNDTVHASVRPGAIVVPRSLSHAPMRDVLAFIANAVRLGADEAVHVRLSPGEIVLPPEVTRDPRRAAAFIEHLRSSGACP